MNYIMDLHTHTLASGHAYSTLMENLRTAKEKGLEVVGLTDHAPTMPGSFHDFYFSNLRVIPDYIDGIRVLKGVELNVLNTEGDVDLDERTLSFLDYAIVSLHPPCIEPGTMAQNTDALIAAMRHKIVKIIGHPDDSRYPLDYERLVLAAKANHVLLEVNNSSLSSDSFRENAEENYITLLTLCKKHEAMIVVNSDCHFHDAIGGFENVAPLLKKMDFPKHLIANFQLKDEVMAWRSTFEKKK